MASSTHHAYIICWSPGITLGSHMVCTLYTADPSKSCLRPLRYVWALISEFQSCINKTGVVTPCMHGLHHWPLSSTDTYILQMIMHSHRYHMHACILHSYSLHCMAHDTSPNTTANHFFQVLRFLCDIIHNLQWISAAYIDDITSMITASSSCSYK